MAFSTNSSSWHLSRPSTDNTHHILSEGTPLYKQTFLKVLPFHSPGIAPVHDSSGSYHINESGEPIYSNRFVRTFGFYEGYASVIDEAGRYYHISPDGNCAYTNARSFDWCGNFQQQRCVVRVEATSKTGKNEYYHIKPNGEFVHGGPYEYAGDYREGYAVVRAADTGLCYHVDLDGKKICSTPGFVDLDVFHKGYARAKDHRGWFHIDVTGRDVSKGVRYADIEPFYNGMALAKQLNGERVVINEDYEVATKLKNPDSELQEKIHSLCVAFWPSFALKLGLEVGLADSDLVDLFSKFPSPSFNALLAAWLDIGLMKIKGGKIVLSELGDRLKSGLPDRNRADYWLGVQMTPWLEASSRFQNPPSRELGTAFFDTLSKESVSLMHRALLTYAQQDWKEVVDHLVFSGITKVVDIGGGFGFLASSIQEKHEHIQCIVVEKPEAVEAYQQYNSTKKVEFIAGDLFSGGYPVAQMYILSRILHDWGEGDCVAILRHLHATLPDNSTLIVIDRIKLSQSSHGLLQLNMLLTTGGTERTEEEFNNLFTQTEWKKISSTTFVNANCAIITLGKK